MKQQMNQDLAKAFKEFEKEYKEWKVALLNEPSRKIAFKEGMKRELKRLNKDIKNLTT